MTLFQSMKQPRKRVVIVDDSRTMQAMLEQILSIRMGFEIVGIASDGESAMSMIPHLRPDLVTIDLHMPYIDGQQLLQNLSAYPALHKVVISSHACNRLSVKTSLELLGADACLDKADMSRDPKAFCDALLAVVRKSKAGAGQSSRARIPDVIKPTPSAMRPGGYPIPFDEAERLAVLQALDLANDDLDHQLDLLTAHLGKTTSFAASAMTFIDAHTQWIKSAYGFDRGSIIRAEAFCNYTICQDDPLIVRDASRDERFRGLESVLGGPMVRSYIGCPIVISSGVRIGALCLFDSKPRTVTVAELTNLRSIAQIAAELIENRTSATLRAA